jgi:hypothetical protein
MKNAILVLALATIVVGCGDDPVDEGGGGVDAAVDTSTDAGGDAQIGDVADTGDVAVADGSGADAASDAVGDAVGSGDGEGSELPPDDCETGETYVYVVSTLKFGREEPRGISPGLNLDGHATRRGEEEGCNIQDMTSPEGEPGIDNNFAKLLPALEAVGGDAVEGLIQAAINDGDLLLVLQVDHVDSLENDRCVDVTVLRGAGLPLVGGDDRIVSGQTFDRATDLPATTVEGVSIVDNVVEAGPFDLTIPVQILGTPLSVSPKEGVIRVELTETGARSGLLAGALLLTDLQGILEEVGGETVVNVAAGLIGDAVDLSVDGGSCNAVSVTLTFEATTGFLFE